MAALGDKYTSLGAEFNKELRRTDGESVAGCLHGRLEQDLRDWFYDRILRIFDGVPESQWSAQERLMSELRGRNEVSCLQSVETAITAREASYIPSSMGEWFVEWCLRLNLGVGAPDAKRYRLDHYWNQGAEKRTAAFCAAIASTLPKTAYSYYFIVLYNPLLLLLTKSTVASAFNDHAIAKSTLREHTTIDSGLQAAINHFISGGGTWYFVSKENQLLITESREAGILWYAWTTSGLAERMSQQHEGSTVSSFNNRELDRFLVNLVRLRVQNIVVNLQRPAKGLGDQAFPV